MFTATMSIYSNLGGNLFMIHKQIRYLPPRFFIFFLLCFLKGNLGNTLKVMGRFDEAAICCERHLTIARSLGDRLSEGRALYNLGNVYHAKGKQLGQKDPGDYSEDVKEALLKAVDFYQQNLALMREIGDRSAQGRSCGNLGNTYYLLGDFQAAIEHHQERLRIAREFGDKAAERRANSNLGNSHIFLGQFELAADHYR